MSSLGLSCAEPELSRGAFESRGGMLARGTGLAGSALPAPRDAEPMPNPETGAVGALFPPLMNIPSGPWPPAPAEGLAFVPFPGVVPSAAPAFDPSGEIEIRAERFPGGMDAGGATGAGVADRAIKVVASPADCCVNSGAAAFLSSLCGAVRGADIGFTGRAGLGGACVDEAILISPALFSGVSISGAAES